MNVIFMGTPDFAVPTLELLIQKHTVQAVVTQPDKPKGRGKKMLYTVIKEKALAHGLQVYQPLKVREPEFIDVLKQYAPDVIVVVAFGQILPEEILNIPKYGCINVHGSLLPKYRGAAPIQWAVINGEKETGVTTMFMAKGLDSGDMILKKSFVIEPHDTYGAVHDKMSVIGAKALCETLELIEKGEQKRQPQKHEQATYAPMITKETGRIVWAKKSAEIKRLIQGLNPAPGAYTILEEEILKIWGLELTEQMYTDKKPGEIVLFTKKGFVVNTGDFAVLITEVQAKGGKKMSADAYLRGHTIELGAVLN